MMYAIEMAPRGMIYVSSFLKIRIGVQAILRFCLSNLNGCNVVLLMEGIYEVRR
jgi:hypothetical protein